MARRNYPFFTDEDVLDASEIAPIDDVTAGTVTASKAVIVGTNKNIDTIVIADGGLKLGTGAGTAVTATAAELNYVDLTAGTGAASKAIVLDANAKWGIGTTSVPITSATASSEFFAWRPACSATSGNSYCTRFNHKVTGAGGSGAAIRGYGFAYGVEAANVYGGEFTAEIHSSSGSAISGQIAAVRAVLSIQGTGSGTGHAISLVSDTASGKSATAASAFIGISCIGAGAATGIKALLNIPAPVAHDTASLFVSSADKAATHMIRFVDAAGTVYWLLATTNEPA